LGSKSLLNQLFSLEALFVFQFPPEPMDGCVLVGLVNMLPDGDVQSIPNRQQLLVNIVESGFFGETKLGREILHHRYFGLNHRHSVFGAYEVL